MEEQVELGDHVGNLLGQLLEQFLVAAYGFNLLVFNQLADHHHGQGQVGHRVFVTRIPVFFLGKHGFHKAYAPVGQRGGVVGQGKEAAGQLQGLAMVEQGVNALLPGLQQGLDLGGRGGVITDGLLVEQDLQPVLAQLPVRAHRQRGQEAVRAHEVQAVFIGIAVQEVTQGAEVGLAQGILFVHKRLRLGG